MIPATYYVLLLLSHSSFPSAQAAPASIGPASLSLNIILTSNSTSAPFLSDEACVPFLARPPLPAKHHRLPTNKTHQTHNRTLESVALFFDSSLVADVDVYRVPNTHTILRIALQDTAIIKSCLARTILRTQQSLSAFIRDYDADDQPLVCTFVPSPFAYPLLNRLS